MSEDLLVLREILQRELETINAYERMLGRLTEPSLRQIVAHITDEEREHVSEVYELIMARDPEQRARAELGRTQIASMSSSMSPSPVEPNPSPIFADGAWSVGSLKVRSV